MPIWVKQINSICSLFFLVIFITCPSSVSETKTYTQSFQITQKMSLRAERTISRFLICCLLQLPAWSKLQHTEQMPHCCSNRPLSGHFVSLCLWRAVALILGQYLLTWPGSTELFRQFYYRYLSEGVCSNLNPHSLHHSQAAGSAVLPLGKSTGRRLWVKLLQINSQKDHCLLPERSALERHMHSSLHTSYAFAESMLYPRRQQRRTSWGTSAYTFHLWDFHTWQLL